VGEYEENILLDQKIPNGIFKENRKVAMAILLLETL
jgi:hypothetical protein